MAQIRTFSTDIQDCLIIENIPFMDNRGKFEETFQFSDFLNAGLPTQFCQDNFSFSNQDVLRGMHILKKDPQGKLVRCVRGRVLDVCVDLRPTSPSYGQTFHIELTESLALYSPPGTAHGFYSITDSIVHYKCTSPYKKEHDGGILWSSIDIPWPKKNPIVSSKDQGLPTIEEYLK